MDVDPQLALTTLDTPEALYFDVVEKIFYFVDGMSLGVCTMVCRTWRDVSKKEELWEIKFRKEYPGKYPRYASWKLSFVREVFFHRPEKPTMKARQISNKKNQFILEYPPPPPSTVSLYVVKSKDGKSARFERKMAKIAPVVKENPWSNIHRFDWKNFCKNEPDPYQLQLVNVTSTTGHDNVSAINI